MILSQTNLSIQVNGRPAIYFPSTRETDGILRVDHMWQLWWTAVEWSSGRKFAIPSKLLGAHSYHISCPKICHRADLGADHLRYPCPPTLIIQPSHSQGQNNRSSRRSTLRALSSRLIIFPKKKNSFKVINIFMS